MNDQSAVERFIEMFRDLTESSVREHAPNIYATNARFNDTIADLTGRGAIVDYLERTASHTESCRVTVDDQATSEDGVYLRWSMRFVAKRLAGGKPLDSIGMTHLRLGDDGLVTLHQDYWDSRQGLFEHVPALGWVLRKAANRLR